MPDSMTIAAEDRSRIWHGADLDRLPRPNRVDVMLSAESPPPELITAAYAIPFLEDGRICLTAHHGPEAHRGVSLPGGHLDPGETAETAAVREALEETGAVVEQVVPVGFIRMQLGGDRPAGYKYPFPVSYQQVFTGLAVAIGPHTETVECAPPLIDDPEQAIARMVFDRDRAIASHAWRIACRTGLIVGPVVALAGLAPTF